MPATITPGHDVTFTVSSMPRALAHRKTIQRLMRLQPDIQKGLKALQKRRARHDNVTYIRAGVPWTNRTRATKLTRVEAGASFTIHVTPQIMKDVASVEKYLTH